MADAITPDDKDWTWVLERPCPECGFDTRTIDNRGSTTWTGGRIIVQNGSTFVNENLFDIQSSAVYIFNGGNLATFNNLATLRKSVVGGTTTFTGGVVFNGTNGQVDALVGALLFQGGGTQTGTTFTPSAGAELQLGGSTFTMSNVTFRGSGLTRINGAVLSFNGSRRPRFREARPTPVVGPVQAGPIPVGSRGALVLMSRSSPVSPWHRAAVD